MLRSLYSGISGMRSFQTKLDVIGNNIANVNTTGFKAGRVMFKEMLSQTMSGVTAPVDGSGGVNAKQIGLGTTIGSIDNVHTPGSAMTTNKTTDLRIDGDGFFAVSIGEDQEIPYLTRSGNFHIDAERKLVNSDGLLVLDTGGAPIILDEEIVAFSIGQNGEIIAVNGDGTSTPTGVLIAIVQVANPEGLTKVGNSLYQLSPNANMDGEFEFVEANDIELGTGAIISGQLEMSNVDLSMEFAEMIVAQRSFQANTRIITTSDEILQELVNLKR